MKLTRLIAIFLTIASSLLVSCGGRSISILQDNSCRPPCWKNIKPGITTEQDVNSILPAIHEVDPDSIKVMSVVSANDSIYFDFTKEVVERGGRIFFRKGIVAAIDFWPLNGILRFGNAIETIGEPENVLALYLRGERIQLSTFLVYPTRGIALLNLQVPFKGEKARVEPDQRVETFWYFDPKLFDELMTGGFISNHPLEVIQNGMQPWTGYGEYPYTQTDW